MSKLKITGIIIMIRTLCSKLLPLGASKGLLPLEAQTAKGIQAPLLPTQGKETRRTFFSSVERDQDWAHLEGYDNVEFLTDQTIDLAINQSNSMLLMFYAPCKTLLPVIAIVIVKLMILIIVNCQLSIKGASTARIRDPSLRKLQPNSHT